MTTVVHSGADGRGSDGGERHGDGEIRLSGGDFGAPDDGGQCEGGFERGEWSPMQEQTGCLIAMREKHTLPALRTGGASLSMYQWW